MPNRPPVELSILRDIAWREWDPIGLAGVEGGSKGNDAADEYDNYLMQVVGLIRDGAAYEAVVDYLVRVEAEHMGLSLTPTTRPRAEATVAGFRRYLQTLA